MSPKNILDVKFFHFSALRLSLRFWFTIEIIKLKLSARILDVFWLLVATCDFVAVRAIKLLDRSHVWQPFCRWYAHLSTYLHLWIGYFLTTKKFQKHRLTCLSTFRSPIWELYHGWLSASGISKWFLNGSVDSFRHFDSRACSSLSILSLPLLSRPITSSDIYTTLIADVIRAYLLTVFQFGNHVVGAEQSSAGENHCRQGDGACHLRVWNHRQPPQPGRADPQATAMLHGSHGKVGARWTRRAGCLRHDVLRLSPLHTFRSTQTREFNPLSTCFNKVTP